MNGLPLLLLATTVGMDFGWQPAVDNPNMLEYIVQLSPEEVQLLNSGKEELFSSIPPELKGRIDRIVIRMGREKLPQEPSLEKLRTMAAVGGNPSILNAGGSAAGTPLAAPNIGSSAPLSTAGGLSTIDPPRTLPSFGNNGSPAPAPPINYGGNYDVLGSGAYEDLLRQGTMPPNTLPNVGNATNIADNTGIPAVPVNQFGNGGSSTLPSDPRSTFPGNGSGGFANVPTTPPTNTPAILPRDNAGSGFVPQGGSNAGAGLPAGGWSSANNTASGANPPRGTSAGAPVGFNNNSMAGNTLGNNPNILPSGNGGNFNNPPVTMASNNGGYNGAGTQYSSNGGNVGGTTSGAGFSNTGNTGNTNQPTRLPPGGNAQFGTNPTLIASSASGNNSLGASSSFEEDELSPSEKKGATEDAEAAAVSASNWEKVLQILFILSIVLNFYLGVHLHKLLLRYRTLLSSVRASATVA